MAYQKYVLGFLFNPWFDRVVLIEKKRPAWQAGKCNGVGGHVEEGETNLAAVIREFREETGVEFTKWYEFCTLKFEGGEVACFYGESIECKSVRSTTDEEIRLVRVQDVINQDGIETIPNLRWLLPMAISMTDDSAEAFVVSEVTYAESD